MSYNLKDFSANNSGCFGGGENASESKKQEAEVKAKEMIGKYQNMSNDELTQTLLSEVAKQKANGTFDRNQLLMMLDAIKGMLPNLAQYEQLREIILKL
ncbi:MAG: hypothetical protein ACI4TX_02635 [Christensenellales bacterium]